MKSQSLIKYVAYTVSSIYALILFALGIHLPSMTLKLLSVLPLSLVLLFFVFDRWLWRLHPLRNMVLHRPRLSGTWRGTLTSIRMDENCKQISSDIHIYLEIRQTFTELSIGLLSPESKSKSTTAEILKDIGGTFTLWWQYQNIPGMPVRTLSPIHFGGSRVDIPVLDPKRLTGEYWTDRMTRGSYQLELMSPKYFGTFEAAETFEEVGQ